MISALAWVLMDKWALDPKPAYLAAWAVVLCAAALLFGVVNLIINGG